MLVWRGSNRMFWYGLNDFWFSHIGPLNKITWITALLPALFARAQLKF